MSDPSDASLVRVALPPAILAGAERVLGALREGTPLVAAVSGGADSVTLVRVLAALAGRWPLAAVAFVDHGLRDVAAERAAAERAALRAGVPFEVRRVTLADGNLQAAARNARYRALLELARARRALLATGHTRSDQAETVLARLVRGAGIAGLSGLAPRKGRLVRPLLEVSRQETRALAGDFVDDPSNASPRFQRNRLRRLLEQLARESPALEAQLAALAEAARGATTLLDALALAAPDADLRGRDQAAVRTFVGHLARVHGARGPRRAPLEAWAKILSRGGLGALSLGEGLRALANEGRAAIEVDDDPRQVVVAWRPGTYRGPSLELEMAEMTLRPETAALAEGEALVPAAHIAWPVRLAPAPRGVRGVFADEVDLESGAAMGGWHVRDASGRTLVPPGGDAVGGGAGPAPGRPGSAGDNHWIRIVLKPFSRPCDTRVVGSGRASLNRE